MSRHATTLAVLALAGVAPASHAQAVLDYASFTTYGFAAWQEGPPGYQQHTNGGNQSNVQTGLDYFDSRPSSYLDDGFHGIGSATNSVAYNPSDPGFGGGFSQITVDLATSAEIAASNPGHYLETVYGVCENYFWFTLAQPANWSWTGELTLTSSPGTSNEARYKMDLHDAGYSTYYASEWVQNVGGAGDVVSQPFAIGGALPAGSYLLHLQLVSGAYGLGVGGSTAELHSGTLSLTVPAPGAAFLLGAAGLTGSRRRRPR
jgi:hypothetical protein